MPTACDNINYMSKKPLKKEVSAGASAMGRLGGLATSKDKAHMSRAGIKGNKIRWGRKLKIENKDIRDK